MLDIPPKVWVIDVTRPLICGSFIYIYFFFFYFIYLFKARPYRTTPVYIYIYIYIWCSPSVCLSTSTATWLWSQIALFVVFCWQHCQSVSVNVRDRQLHMTYDVSWLLVELIDIRALGSVLQTFTGLQFHLFVFCLLGSITMCNLQVNYRWAVTTLYSR